MKKIKNKPTIKMNLSLEKDFYDLLQANAKQDYVKVSTWVKQFLKRNLLDVNKCDSKVLTSNENEK
jgi:hypothetical protein